MGLSVSQTQDQIIRFPHLVTLSHVQHGQLSATVSIGALQGRRRLCSGLLGVKQPSICADHQPPFLQICCKNRHAPPAVAGRRAPLTTWCHAVCSLQVPSQPLPLPRLPAALAQPPPPREPVVLPPPRHSLVTRIREAWEARATQQVQKCTTPNVDRLS